jgi:cell division protein FtsI/penicillin-binding protein 2
VNASWRIVVVGGVLAAMLGVLGLRLWTLQITGVEEYQGRAESNQIRLVNTPAPRGDVFDRNGILLAGTRPSLAVVVDMALVTDETVGQLASNLAAFLDEPEEHLLETFEGANSGAQLILARDLSEERALLLLEHREDFPGVAVIPQPVREYPGGDLAAHVLGYIGRPSAEDLERPDVKGNDVVGKAGVERVYDRELRGTEGIVKYQVDADRTVLSKAGEQAPRPGSNLYLTIDAATQAQLQASLQEGLELARRLEMEERVDALELQDVETRMALARQEAITAIREAAIRAAEIAEEDEGAASVVAARDELADLPRPDELEEGEVLGALYDGLPLDFAGVCVPVQRLAIDSGERARLSGTVERSIRLVNITAGRADDRVAVVIVDGERFTLQEGDRFATTLRVTDIETDRVVLTHSDKYCPVRSVAVVQDPTDGSVIAMGSYPTYDPTAFVSGLTSEEWVRLGTENAFTNFAVQGLFAPASTFKVVAYMLAMEEGIYPLDRPIGDRVLGGEQSEEDVEFGTDQPPVETLLPLTSDTDPYFCTGSLRFEFNDGSSQVYRDWKRSGHGQLDLHGALEASCDLYFWEIALRVWNERADDEGINNENLWQEWARAFGFGEVSGVDLPFEKQGLIPDRTWFRDEQRAGTGRVRATGPWVGGDLMNAVVGQGTVLVTPLQLANGFSAMVNGGTVWQPRVVDRITNQSGTVIDPRDPIVLQQVDLDSKTVTAFRNDLQMVVNGSRGTARRAFETFGAGVSQVGGKTGTAEIIKSDDEVLQVDTGWFVGVAPVYNPEYVVSVVVERGGSGGKVAAPIARQILQHLMNGPGAVTPLEAGEQAD